MSSSKVPIVSATVAVYRPILAEEEEEAMRLWTSVFPVPAAFFQTLMDVQEDRSLEQTRVAVVDSKIVSALHVFYRQNRGLDGRLLKMGAIGSVATYEDARKQGHSGRLLEDVIELMERDGCDWSLLFTGVNQHYARFGWKTIATYSRQGPLRSGETIMAGTYRVAQIPPNEFLPLLKRIHDSYDERRPLSTVRTLRAWETAISYRMSPESKGAVFGAWDGEEIVAYMFVRFRDSELSVEELACLPRHEQGLVEIAEVIRKEAARRGMEKVHAWLPEEPFADKVTGLLAKDPERLEHGYVMARPIGSRMTMREVEDLFTAPGAIHWQLDNF